MAARLTETLLGADADMHRIHRRVVRIGATAGWMTAAFFLVVGISSRNSSLYLESVVPALAAGLMTAQIIVGRENGGMALFGSAFVTLVINGVVGTDDTLIPAAVAMVIIPAIGTLFLNRFHLVFVGLISSGLLIAPLAWGLDLGPSLTLGAVMAISFALTSVILLTVRSAAVTLNARSRTLFEYSPSAVIEEDWSDAIAYLRSEYTGRADRIKPFLMAYPAVVKRAVAKVRILRVNQAAIELLEAVSPADLVGYRDSTTVTPETMESFVDTLVAWYEGQTSFDQEAPAFTVTGREIWLQTHSVDTASGLPSSNILVGLADITDFKAHNDAMTDLVKAKDEFVAQVSHELRTPLTAVVGLTSELTTMENLGEEERVELLSLVTSQAAEMSYMVDDLLVAARAEMGTIAIESGVVDLQSELQSVVDGLGLNVEKLPEFVPSAVADPSRVRQIFRNLFTNAQRYGGPNVWVNAGKTNDMAWIEVRDDGDGVAASDVERIFEPYAVAHGGGVSGSVGLGLTVSRQLAELMHGTLTHHRDMNESVFRLELPVAANSEPVLTSKKASV